MLEGIDDEYDAYTWSKNVRDFMNSPSQNGMMARTSTNNRMSVASSLQLLTWTRAIISNVKITLKNHSINLRVSSNRHPKRWSTDSYAKVKIEKTIITAKSCHVGVRTSGAGWGREQRADVTEAAASWGVHDGETCRPLMI